MVFIVFCFVLQVLTEAQKGLLNYNGHGMSILGKISVWRTALHCSCVYVRAFVVELKAFIAVNVIDSVRISYNYVYSYLC